ncbi:GDSL esterase/lipase At1g06990-like [Mercurialis annua]|uniref:GDSL esterase/lipase At1g06990-like n=1 Tax=Mercurialis annua TaxID=3986 RepID=UPI00216011F5|nr:GDSL esterase/lipase At1g06990-like [Mercurialis annua]
MAVASLLFQIFATTIIIFFTLISIAEATNLPNFSSILVFGDSTVDTGNNNYIQTFFQANHTPYGQDFPGRIPTGRFSNGKLIPDFIASLLNIKQTVPPFLDPTLSDDELRTGVCFASAGTGYDDLTAAEARVISMPEQLELFRNYMSRLKRIVGEDESNNIISGSLIIVSAGTNDFVYNYYDALTRRIQFDISAYQDYLLTILQNFIKELYNLGGRSIVIVGLPPVGCLPLQITATFKNSMGRNCLEDQNSDSQAYNVKLTKLLSEIQASAPESLMVYANVYDPLIDMINHPQKFGLVETSRGCCGSGLVEAASFCNAATPKCDMPTHFLFWDAIHPSQAAYKSLSASLQKHLIPILSP